MMKKFKLFATPLALAASIFCASASFGQTPITPQIVAVGSSGIFAAAGIAAVSTDPITGAAAPCGTNFWTGNTNVADGLDGRSAGIPTEPGKVWIAWDNSTQPTIVCAFLTVDSVVGQRLFFSQHQSPVTGGQINGVLQVSSSAVGAAGSNLIPYITDTASLPAVVQQSVNGQQFNVAFTDIRPEDAQYFNIRAQCSPADSNAQCLGYGPFPVGTAVQSSYSINTATGAQNSAQVVQYNINGDDPISEYPIPAFTTVPIGAEAVIHFVNITDTTSGGFGSLNPTNVNSHVLAVVYAGFLGLTTDITGTNAPTVGKPLHVMLREPTSGTMNTFEWQIARAKGVDLSQEFGIQYGTRANCTSFTPSPATPTYATPTTSGPCTNPLYLPGPQGSFRARVIGTGEAISAVNSGNNPNSIGYAFWSFSNFKGKTGLKYLELDGVDPLSLATYTGAFPTCTGTANSGGLTCQAVPFTAVQNGNYRNFNVLRATYYSSYTPPATGPSLTKFIQIAQDQAAKTIFDFVPTSYCANSACSSTVDNVPVFKSHYVLPSQGINAANGTHGEAEGGGDVLGAVFTQQADIDYFTTTGTELTEYLQ